MRDLTLADEMQLAILPHIRKTEELATRAIKKETGKEGCVIITAMPDLGLANNPIRMQGGFFTGMHIAWDADIPFVPVDATVNCCGVAIYSLNGPLSPEEFHAGIERAKVEAGRSGRRWNFDRGNHFILLCRADDGREYAVLHASADEYKTSLPSHALYPVPGVWYESEIKVIYSEDGYRFLRYLTGSPAERFIAIARQLEKINQERMQAFSNEIFGNRITGQLCCIPHYGMPNESSIAIGCSWNHQRSILLTAPGKDIFLIENRETSSIPWLTPHGFGVEISHPAISYGRDGLRINRTLITDERAVASLNSKGIRMAHAEDEVFQKHVSQILQRVNARIAISMKPLMAISRDGFVVYEKGEKHGKENYS